MKIDLAEYKFPTVSPVVITVHRVHSDGSEALLEMFVLRPDQAISPRPLEQYCGAEFVIRIKQANP